jgi:hypothetical protein
MSENFTSTTLTITNGLTLILDGEHMRDAISEAQLERARLVFDRTAQLAELHAIVRRLFDDAGDQAERHFDRILEALGWSSTRHANVAELAAAIETLAEQVVEGPRLALGLEVAQLEQHKWWGRREEIRAREAAEVAS